MILSKRFCVALSALVAVTLNACGAQENSNKPVVEQSNLSEGEEFLAENATAEEFAALGLTRKKKSLGKSAVQSINQQTAQAANKQQRAANINKALSDLRAVRGLVDKGLMQAKAKCDAISGAVASLKGTNSPQRPFDGLRKQFRKALRAERQKVLSANGVTSCGKVRNLVMSLPPAAPVAPQVADEEVPSSDPIDEIVIVLGLLGR